MTNCGRDWHYFKSPNGDAKKKHFNIGIRNKWTQERNQRTGMLI